MCVIFGFDGAFAAIGGGAASAPLIDGGKVLKARLFRAKKFALSKTPEAERLSQFRHIEI